MKELLVKILEEEGPQLSSALGHRLAERAGISPASARQRISRRSSEIKRLKGIKFPHNSYFIYLEKYFGSETYWMCLTNELLKSGSIYGHTLASMLQRDGIVPLEHFSIACGAPVKQKKHLSPSTILRALCEIKLLQIVEVPEIGKCVAIVQGDGHYEGQTEVIRSRLITERILLQAVREWARNLGFFSYNLAKIRDEEDEQPRVSTIEWDLAGPSYLAGLVGLQSGTKPKPGFVACDVYLGKNVTEDGIRPFIHKCETLRALRNVGRCLQIFVADKFSPEAYKLAKSKGIMPATTANLFGKDVAKAFKKLLHMLADVAGLCRDSETLGEIFERLDKIEGAATNLRGAVFAYISAEMARKVLGANQIEMGRKFEDGEEKAEVDIVATVQHKKIHFIECKGYQPRGTVEDEDVTVWLDKRLPFLFRVAQNHPEWKRLKCCFHFWTSSNFSEESTKELKKAASKTKRYEIEYLDGKGFGNLAKETGDKALIQTLTEHFTNHPLVEATRAVEKRRRKTLADAKFGLSDDAKHSPVDVDAVGEAVL